MRHVPPPGSRPPIPPDDPALLARGTDPITGLLTREALLEALRRRSEAPTIPATPFALLAIELDGLARATDALGRPGGEPLLRAVAQRIRGNIRGGDLLAWLGAEEFAILLPGPTPDTDAEGLAGRLGELFERPFAVEGVALATAMACRIGIALYPDDAWQPEQLMAHARQGRLDGATRREAARRRRFGPAGRRNAFINQPTAEHP